MAALFMLECFVALCGLLILGIHLLLEHSVLIKRPAAGHVPQLESDSSLRGPESAEQWSGRWSLRAKRSLTLGEAPLLRSFTRAGGASAGLSIRGRRFGIG